MAYGEFSAASTDVGTWVPLDASYTEDWNSPQVALVSVSFSDSGATATIGFALVGPDGSVHGYYEGQAAALARRSSGDGLSGRYLGAVDFVSGSAPASYSVVSSNKVDLMHGLPSDYGLSYSGGMKWVFGVSSLSAGTVYVSVATSPVI